MNPLTTQREAAEKYKISSRTVSQKLRRAKIKPVVKIGQTYMYDPQQLHLALVTTPKPIKASKETEFNKSCQQFLRRKHESPS